MQLELKHSKQIALPHTYNNRNTVIEHSHIIDPYSRLIE